jgi:hypothetical protein
VAAAAELGRESADSPAVVVVVREERPESGRDRPKRQQEDGRTGKPVDPPAEILCISV